MADPLHFTPPAYAGGRHLMMCGSIEFGAVYPPPEPYDHPWCWRVWVTPNGAPRHGTARTEQAAKNAALGIGQEFIRASGLTGSKGERHG